MTRTPIAPDASATKKTTMTEVLPVEDLFCEDNVEVRSVGSVIVIHAKTMKRALAPVIHAACACTRAGALVTIATVIVPEDGTVTAHAQEDIPADECIQRTLDGRFTPFELQSDCIDCGPKRYGVFHGSSAPPAPRSRINYPLKFVHR